MVDLKLSRATGGWMLAAIVKNLFDEKYFSYGVYTGFPTYAALPAPERSLFLSAEYRFR